MWVLYKKAFSCFAIFKTMLFPEVVSSCDTCFVNNNSFVIIYCCVSIMLSIYLSYQEYFYWSFVSTQLTRLCNGNNLTSREISIIFDIKIPFEKSQFTTKWHLLTLRSRKTYLDTSFQIAFQIVAFTSNFHKFKYKTKNPNKFLVS